MRGNRVKSAGANHVGRTDEAFRRAEIHHVATLFNRTANNGFNAMPNWLPNAATVVTCGGPALLDTLLVDLRLGLAAFVAIDVARRIAFAALAHGNGGSARFAAFGSTARHGAAGAQK